MRNKAILPSAVSVLLGLALLIGLRLLISDNTAAGLFAALGNAVLV